MNWKLRIVIPLAWLLAATLPLTAADVTGKWIFDVNLDIGGGSPTFTFQQEGESLTGKYSGAAGEADVTGKVSGDSIQFEFKTEWGTVKYQGTIQDADQMKGVADYAGQAKGNWTAKRAK